MGIVYYQHALMGIRYSSLLFNRVVNDAVWETQNRYDTKTGKISGAERVLVKEAEREWFFPNTNIMINVEYVSKNGLVWAIEKLFNIKKIDLKALEFEDYIYLGKSIGLTNADYGCFRPLEGYVSPEEFEEIKRLTLDNLRAIDYNNPEQFGLYFVPEFC